MKRLLSLYFILSFCFALGSCSSDMSEAEVYQVLNQIIADNKLQLGRVCQDLNHLHLKNDYKEVFSEEDLQFIQRQKLQFSSFKLKPKSLRYYNERYGRYDYVGIDSTCSTGSLYHISFPIVSKDRQKALIEINKDCNCMLGGQGGKNLFVRKNGKWVKEKSFDWWIGLNN